MNLSILYQTPHLSLLISLFLHVPISSTLHLLCIVNHREERHSKPNCGAGNLVCIVIPLIHI